MPARKGLAFKEDYMPKIYVANTLNQSISIGYNDESGRQVVPFMIEAGKQISLELSDSMISNLIAIWGLVHCDERTGAVTPLIFNIDTEIPADKIIGHINSNSDVLDRKAEDRILLSAVATQDKLKKVAADTDLSNVDVSVSIKEADAENGTKGKVKSTVIVKG